MTSHALTRPLLIAAAFAIALIGLTGCGSDDATGGPQLAYTTAADYVADSGFQGMAYVSRGGQVVLNQGFGPADRATGELNGADKRYRIGSLTKAFTALAVVRLKADGLITSFDDPVSTYFPDYPRGDEITLRHLLTHRSGLPDYLAFVDETQAHDPEELVEAVMDEPLHFTPGSEFEYSNTNYAALGVLIEARSGVDYMTYLRTAVLEPLGLEHIAYGTDPITADDDARGYRDGAPAAPTHMSVPYAAGALVSTAGDLAAWGESVLAGTLIPAADRADVLPPMPADDGANAVGMGWFSLNFGGTQVYQHGGDIHGFTAVIALVPDTDGVLVLLSNEETQSVLRYEVMEMLLEHELVD